MWRHSGPRLCCKDILSPVLARYFRIKGNHEPDIKGIEQWLI